MTATVTLPNGETKEVTLTQFIERGAAPIQDQLWHEAYQSKGEKIVLKKPNSYQQIIEETAIGTSAQILKDTNYSSMADAIHKALAADDSLKEKLNPIIQDASHNYAMYQKKAAHQHSFSDIEQLATLRKNALDHQIRIEKALRTHHITIDLSHEQGVPPPQTHGAAQIDKAHTNERAVG